MSEQVNWRKMQGQDSMLVIRDRTGYVQPGQPLICSCGHLHVAGAENCPPLEWVLFPFPEGYALFVYEAELRFVRATSVHDPRILRIADQVGDGRPVLIWDASRDTWRAVQP